MQTPQLSCRTFDDIRQTDKPDKSPHATSYR